MITRKLINMDRGDGRPLMCAWDDCEADGVQLHRTRVQHGTTFRWFCFCSDRHRMYWVNSHRSLGNLPAGYKKTLQ